ncbi:DUF3265 domain-containing protein [Vibrio kanaloae]|nr:DUF3265 domain-containing protein [Vibrio kanaloae]
MRNVWHFQYALIYVFKVPCGGFVLRCSLLSLALVSWRTYEQFGIVRASLT